MKYKNSSGIDLKKIVRFFDQGVSRYIFLVIDDELTLSFLIKEILVNFIRKKKRIRILELTENERSVYRQVETFAAGEKSDGLIVTGLNLLIYKYTHECLDLLNKSRDAFKKFGLPIVFIVNTDNLSRIVNGASDFYQLRDLPDFHFKAPAGPERKEFLTVDFSYEGRIPDGDLKAGLLEKQLEIAKKKQRIDNNVLNNIVSPLLAIYIAGSHYKKMKALFNDYLQGNEDKIKNRKVLHYYYLKMVEVETLPMYPENERRYLEDLIENRWYCIQTGNWNRAAEITFDLEIYLTSHGYPQWSMGLLRELDLKKLNAANQMTTFGQLGNLYLKLGELDKSISLYKKAYEIAERNENTPNMAAALHQIGFAYWYKGRHDDALTHFEKSLEMNEKIGNTADAASSRAQMGRVYFEKKEYPIALKLSLRAYSVFLKLGSPKAENVKDNILLIRKQMPEEQFNNILESVDVKLDQ